MKNFLINQSMAVRTLVIPEVRSVIDNVQTDYDGVRPYKTSVVEWLKPVVDLSGFYVYPMNGITEGLNWWYNRELRSVVMTPGDYQWIEPKLSNYPAIPQVTYISVPSAIDGNFIDVPNRGPIALDLAYIGSTRIQKIEVPDNVEYAFYSLSKSFGIRNVRTGWFFSRKKDDRLEDLIHKAKYYNYYAQDISEAVINNFSIDYVHNYFYEQQKQICKELNFAPSDSVWLATTEDKDYKKFRRSGNLARICLAGVYNEKA